MKPNRGRVITPPLRPHARPHGISRLREVGGEGINLSSPETAVYNGYV